MQIYAKVDFTGRAGEEGEEGQKTEGFNSCLFPQSRVVSPFVFERNENQFLVLIVSSFPRIDSRRLSRENVM